jgi:hypothetical protein
MRTYYLVPDWIDALGLSLQKTIILAVVHGFSQDGRSKFYGTYDYLARKIHATRRSAIKHVSELVEAGFLIKEPEYHGPIQVNTYRLNYELIEKLTNEQTGPENAGEKPSSPGEKISHRGEKFSPPGEKISSNNNINNNIYNIYKGETKVSPPLKALDKEKQAKHGPKNIYARARENLARPGSGGSGPVAFETSGLWDDAVLVQRFREMPEKTRAKYRGVDIYYYRDVIGNWAEANNKRKKDWFRTILNAILRDMKDGKVKMLPIKEKQEKPKTLWD